MDADSGEDFETDALQAWLADCLRKDRPAEDALATIEERVAAFREGSERHRVVYFCEPLEATPGREHSQEPDADVPTDDTIRNQVRACLRQLDTGV